MSGQAERNQVKKRFCAGVLAHVDAGKTTLSEALLYCSGSLRKLGRVDHGNAFLDTESLERERGITIFSKQARLRWGSLEIQLLDTPGHVDFSAETERTLQVLDCAILVISGSSGVQGHTRTLWRLLEKNDVPTFIFVNKMDLAGTDRAVLLAELKRYFGDGCVDFGAPDEARVEQIALCGEEALAEFLDRGSVCDETVSDLIRGRRLFPVRFGSALKLDGVEECLTDLERYGPELNPLPDFAARVYKISRDPQGGRLTWMKITGGILRVKDTVNYCLSGSTENTGCSEKADQLRLYSGEKYQLVEAAPAGTVCAVTGLSGTWPGQGLGAEEDARAPLLEPVLSYRVILPPEIPAHTALQKLRLLEEEDPQLHVTWDETTRQIGVQLMGTVQLEVLQRLIADRFSMTVNFGAGDVVYRETIAAPVEGIGHFEPLRHYAEVHLLLEPGERGSGMRFGSAVSQDDLDLNWQRLILTHLEEREHRGVLTGSPITDMKITVIAGRAHLKHTEGGDFRQATWRAVRQGLMQAESVLLEPWYEFRLELPTENVGRAMTDIQQMGGETQPPEMAGEETILTGSAPVSALRDYAAEVTAYTRGRGRLHCIPCGYRPCGDQEAAVAARGYLPERDVDNPADSVFCDHSSGGIVPWNQVSQMAHIPPMRQGRAEEPVAAPVQRPERRSAPAGGSFEQDKELQAIFERTYGAVRRRGMLPMEQVRRQEAAAEERRRIKPQVSGPEYLLVDGYNIIFAWDELKAVARDNLDAARKNLMDVLSNYQGFRQNIVIVVFDAYKVPGNPGSVEKYHNIDVVYTKESQTADAYIEKATYELGRNHRVRVATSDNTEQLIILGHGALRVSASAFREEVESVEGQIADLLRRSNAIGGNRAVAKALEKAAEKQ